MIRILASAVLNLLSNAVALLVTSVVLEGVELDALGFVTAVLLFTITGIFVEPLLRQMAFKSAPVLAGSSALISTLVSLVVTAVISDGLSINGITYWLLATVMVWGVALGARLLLPLFLFKKALSSASNNQS